MHGHSNIKSVSSTTIGTLEQPASCHVAVRSYLHQLIMNKSTRV